MKIKLKNKVTGNFRFQGLNVYNQSEIEVGEEVEIVYKISSNGNKYAMVVPKDVEAEVTDKTELKEYKPITIDEFMALLNPKTK